MKTLTIAQITLLSLAGMLTACAGSSGSSDLASRSTSSSTSSTTSNGTLTSCNQGKSASVQLNLMSYAVNGAYRNDLMRAKITSIADAFKTTSNYIQMFRWQALSNSLVYLDPTPVNIRLEKISDGTVLTNYQSYLRWSDISYVATNLGVSTPADLFNLVRLTIDIRDPNAEYDVLKVGYYNSSNTALESFDMLMPLFTVNPNDYSTQPDGTSRPSVLKNLHPFKSSASQGWPTSHYMSIAQGYCF